MKTGKTRLARGCGVVKMAALMITGLAGAAVAQPYQTEVNRFVAQDALDVPVSGSVVFIGSSSIRRWEQLTLDFADYNVIQRGLGGAQFDDINLHVDDIVLPYNPRAIVVWAGTNDLAAGADGNEVVADYQTFINQVHRAQPNVDIFYLGIMPTPGRQGNKPKEDITNAGIAAIAADNAKLHYIDLPAAFSTLNPYTGDDFSNKFVDSIHLNRQGYEFWSSIIRPQLEAVVAPNKVFTPNPNTLQVGDRLLFDFGPSNPDNGRHTTSPDINGNHWNNWFNSNSGSRVLAGEHKTDLIDTDGNNTGVRLTITGEFGVNSRLNRGLLSPDAGLLDDLAILSATEDFFFSTSDGKQQGGDDDIAGGFMLDGLNPDKLYTLRFSGSRVTSEPRVTEYRVIGMEEHTVQLQTPGINRADGNEDKIAEAVDIRPDGFGQIFVDLILIRGDLACVSAMEVAVTGQVSDPGTPDFDN